MGELQRSLKDNETAFDAWAKTVGLSDDTVKRLKDSIKAKSAASKDAAKDARELEAAEKSLRDELEAQAGVLTQRGLNTTAPLVMLAHPPRIGQRCHVQEADFEHLFGRGRGCARLRKSGRKKTEKTSGRQRGHEVFVHGSPLHGSG